ncbi:hypothetical protein [Tenacibaculum finnmarkense]|uniref:Uncharacterized protein n=1 Tax=Tenacibaculum finnmarkense genomovar finnmarkense TaxID=1458503 RepID=A0AAP1RHE3_9FLAO|nr:hypothetical protein [Tenacibaculum finnmarkense]MBE7653959.1 hypothetical protein [Tenacibaculum finnmarkense genomovar finnmarkense]MBE7696255.1 hypothetical protein [Tenacibaculum finnmarkense genomovar finnmarkense]MCD8428506.1 hypothetical protein [Tenacibaculum finnmarkense genomovar finnmarkense]MCG8732273.1 hypothetical protein [Tenacibaculum finnmarkense]MCG8752993.1 hypothetical protein [Tenacibaculum finnmarkense]
MSRFTSYKIVENKLILTENLYWTFEPNRKDSIQVWTFNDFDKKKITVENLENLISYNEDADIEIENNKSQIKVDIFTYFDNQNYEIHCSNYGTEIRPYNIDELNKIILNNENQFEKDEDEIQKYSEFIEKLSGFIENEKTKRERILNKLNETNSESSKKEKSKLKVLKQFENMILNFKQK